MAEHVRIWRYRVKPAQRKLFLHHYSTDGTWTQLFQQADGYQGTTLWQDAADENVFYTQDCWHSEDDYNTFQREYAAVYSEIDRQLEELTAEETFIGAMNSAG